MSAPACSPRFLIRALTFAAATACVSAGTNARSSEADRTLDSMDLLYAPLWGLPADVTSELGVSTYPVQGGTGEAAYTDMMRRAPTVLPFTGRSVGEATYGIVARWTTGPTAGPPGQQTCGVRGSTVTLSLQFTLPEWAGMRSSDPASMRQWIQFRAALDRHEARHAALAHATASNMRTSLIALRAPCDRISAEAMALRVGFMERLRVANQDLDQRTDHGRKEGTLFSTATARACRLPRSDSVPTVSDTLHGIAVRIPRTFWRATASDRYAALWTDGAGQSMTLDFRLGAEPQQRFHLDRLTHCAGLVGGHPAHVVRGRAEDGDWVVVARWAALGGSLTEPAGNAMMLIARGRTEAAADMLAGLFATIDRAR